MKKRWIVCMLLCLCLAAQAALAQAEGGGGAAVPQLDQITRYDIPDNAAMAFVRQMGVGWNLGNTFDAVRDDGGGNEMSIEGYWCGVRTSVAMIEALREAGFSTIRIPVSWHNHVDEDFNISAPWLDRVQEVVDWAVARDMFVIVNIHHDVYERYYYPSEACYATSEAYVSRIWRQLAERFGGYDHHLIFESVNEPRLKDTQWEWWLDTSAEACVEAAECVNRLNQVFVDTVRATGGNNAGRYLMVPGYDASPGNAVNDLFALPSDAADNRIIVSAHAYTPYPFALEEGGESRFSLSSATQTGEIQGFMNSLYAKYVSQGIPVVIGEFGARDKGGNLQDRVDFTAYYVAQASARNIPCCWWDNNSFFGGGENFGLFHRADCTWPYPQILEALLRYGGYDRIPSKP